MHCLHCPGHWKNLLIQPHYYKNVDLSRLGNHCCPGFPTGNSSPGQKGVPLCPGWCYEPGQKVPFFHIFLFSILFLFQLYFCILIKLMYWNSVCMISTNIYIYCRGVANHSRVAERTRLSPEGVYSGVSKRPVRSRLRTRWTPRVFEWFGPPERNTIRPLCVVLPCLERVCESLGEPVCVF